MEPRTMTRTAKKTAKKTGKPKARKPKGKAKQSTASKGQTIIAALQSQEERLAGLGNLASRPRAEHGAIAQADGAPARDSGAGDLLPKAHGTDSAMTATQKAKDACRAAVGQRVARVRNGDRQEGTVLAYAPGKPDAARPFTDSDGNPEGPHARVRVQWDDGKSSTVNYGRFAVIGETEGSLPLTRDEADSHRKTRQEAAELVKAQAQDLKAADKAQEGTTDSK